MKSLDADAGALRLARGHPRSKLAATIARSLQAGKQAELRANIWRDRHYPNRKLDAARVY